MCSPPRESGERFAERTSRRASGGRETLLTRARLTAMRAVKKTFSTKTRGGYPLRARRTYASASSSERKEGGEREGDPPFISAWREVCLSKRNWRSGGRKRKAEETLDTRRQMSTSVSRSALTSTAWGWCATFPSTSSATRG